MATRKEIKQKQKKKKAKGFDSIYHCWWIGNHCTCDSNNLAN